jgi:hypothetical protein
MDADSSGARVVVARPASDHRCRCAGRVCSSIRCTKIGTDFRFNTRTRARAVADCLPVPVLDAHLRDGDGSMCPPSCGVGARTARVPRMLTRRGSTEVCTRRASSVIADRPDPVFNGGSGMVTRALWATLGSNQRPPPCREVRPCRAQEEQRDVPGGHQRLGGPSRPPIGPGAGLRALPLRRLTACPTSAGAPSRRMTASP